MYIPAALYAVSLYTPHVYKRISLRCTRECAGVDVTRKRARTRSAGLLLLACLAKASSCWPESTGRHAGCWLLLAELSGKGSAGW